MLTQRQVLKAIMVCLSVVVLSITAMILTSCTPVTQYTPVCQDYAVFGAYSDSIRGYNVRIMAGNEWTHVQHQAYIDGVWRWRCFDGQQWRTCAIDDGFWPNEEFTLAQFLQRTMLPHRASSVNW